MMQSLSILCRKARNFRKLQVTYKLMFLEAYILSGIFRILILVIAFGRIKKYIGIYNMESSENLVAEKYKIIKNVAWVVHTACRYTPWESKCLVQALTAQKMLRKRKISSTLYLGIAKNNKNNINAHAWLRSGSIIVTGASVHSQFTVVAKFSNEGKIK